jgi:hypothetical protein
MFNEMLNRKVVIWMPMMVCKKIMVLISNDAELNALSNEDKLSF